MKKCKTLKEFIRNCILVISSGYTNYKIVQIPEKKIYRKGEIFRKIECNYQTNLTRSQRYYAKSKGFANFKAIQYKETIFICYTKGTIKPNIDKGEGWLDFNIKRRLRLNISLYMAINIYKDEREKITAKVDTLIFRDTKAEIKECFKTKNGFRYHNILKKWHNLPRYRGIQLQKKELVFYINKLKKDSKSITWKVPFKYL